VSFVEALTDARDTVAAADIVCTLDPKELTTLPAVWIRFDGLAGPVLAGGVAGRSRALVTVFVIVPPVDPVRDLTALEPFLVTVAGIIPPMSDPRHVAVVIPGGGTPAPAMSYTHDLVIQADPEGETE
jgi:hypothetical protein